MAEPLGFPQRLATYATNGGAEINTYALGYQQAGRFGPDGPAELTSAQTAAYKAGLADRRLEDSLLPVIPPLAD